MTAPLTGRVAIVTGSAQGLGREYARRLHQAGASVAVIDVNLTAQWLCVRALTPRMRETGYGKIINISSSMVTKGWPLGLAPYMAAKAGVVGLTRALAKELGPDGIRTGPERRRWMVDEHMTDDTTGQTC